MSSGTPVARAGRTATASERDGQDDDRQQSAQQDRQSGGQQGGQQQNRQQGQQGQQNQQGQQGAADDGQGGSRRSRRRRGRDRDHQPAAAPAASEVEPDTTILDDDVLTPAAGILDVLDNYAFVRTSGYLPGTDDVYVSLSMVRKFGLRRGDAIVGQVRQPREGERREKFNPMVRIDSVNGADPEAAKNRVGVRQAHPAVPAPSGCVSRPSRPT